MSPSEQSRWMAAVIASYQQKFIEALALSAARGGFRGDMPSMVARLAMWIRADFAGTTTFQEWDTLTQEASQLWDNWYDWYSRFYTRPNDLLGGLSLDEYVRYKAS